MNEQGVSGKLGGAQVRLKWRPAAVVCGALTAGICIGLLAGSASSPAVPVATTLAATVLHGPGAKRAAFDQYIMHDCDNDQFQITMRKNSAGEYEGGWVRLHADALPGRI